MIVAECKEDYVQPATYRSADHTFKKGQRHTVTYISEDGTLISAGFIMLLNASKWKLFTATLEPFTPNGRYDAPEGALYS